MRSEQVEPAANQVLRSGIVRMASKLSNDWMSLSADLRRRALAGELLTLVQELASSERRRLSARPTDLLPMAHQIDLWFTRLDAFSACEKSLLAVGTYVSSLLAESHRTGVIFQRR